MYSYFLSLSLYICICIQHDYLIDGLISLREGAEIECGYNSDSNPLDMINKRVEIKWRKEWFKATVQRYNPKSGEHFIKYDDNDEHWNKLHTLTMKLLNEPSSPDIPMISEDGSTLIPPPPPLPPLPPQN